MTISDLAYLENMSVETSSIVSGGITVKVFPGETLSGLTSYFYADGTPSCYNPVAAINNINPDRIKAGQKLNFPSYVPGCGELVRTS